MNDRNIPYSTLINFSGTILVLGITLVLMIYGRPVVRPIVVAIVITFLITAIAEPIENLNIFGWNPPPWLARAVAILFFALIFRTLFRMSSDTIRELIADRDLVINNINNLISSSPNWLLSFLPREAQLGPNNYDASVLFSMGLDFLTDFSRQYIGRAASMAGQFLIVLVYVIFMLIEQQNFADKISEIKCMEPPPLQYVHDNKQTTPAFKTQCGCNFNRTDNVHIRRDQNSGMFQALRR